MIWKSPSEGKNAYKSQNLWCEVVCWKSHMKMLGTVLRTWRYVRKNVWLLNIILRLYNNRSFAQALILRVFFGLFYCCIKSMCKKIGNVIDPLIHQYLPSCCWTSLSVRTFQSLYNFMPICQIKLEKTRTQGTWWRNMVSMVLYFLLAFTDSLLRYYVKSQ